MAPLSIAVVTFPCKRQNHMSYVMIRQQDIDQNAIAPFFALARRGALPLGMGKVALAAPARILQRSSAMTPSSLSRLRFVSHRRVRVLLPLHNSHRREANFSLGELLAARKTL